MVNGKGSSRLSSHRVVFELKQRVAVALNKIADRDTYQLGVVELDKIVECLTPDLIPPLLSCILDSDSEKKSAVRKECIRLMGALAGFHGAFIGPYLGKMVASIVKRLRDSDSVVRDACVETIGVLAAKLGSDRVDNDGVFIALVRPLFESLGEQNKQMQSGSALCLSRVIDTIHDPPPLVLQKMLERTVKLLRNPHFMGKPEVIMLNRSIILAGGAPTHNFLTNVLMSIQESLKSNDWKVRKAACSALADIASCGAAFLDSYLTSCIRSLESCRFDKVKPVRDIALQALQNWKNIPGANAIEPSEAGSPVKEAYYRDEYGDITSSSESKLRDISLVKFRSELTKKRIPLSSRKSVRSYTGNSQNSGTHDWPVEIAVQKDHRISVSENQNDEFQCSSVTKGCEMKTIDSRIIGKIEVNSLECSKSQVVSTNSDALDDPSSLISSENTPKFSVDEISIDEQRNMSKIHDRRSIESRSTVTESMSHTISGFYQRKENEMEALRKQLLEIENKQSNLMDMLHAFTASVMDSVSMVLLKVSNLELVLDKMGEELVHTGRDRNSLLSTNLFKRSPDIASSRLSVPQPSDDSTQQPLLRQVKHAGLWEENASTGVRADVTLKNPKSNLGKGTKSFCSQIHSDQENGQYDSVPMSKTRVNNLAPRNSHWNITKTYLPDGDIESAYVEALCSRNETFLFELLERTGPILEHLCSKTVNNLLITLASYLMERRFVSLIIPWLQQLVDLCSIHGPTYLVLSANVKRDMLYGVQEASTLAMSRPSERKCIAEIREELHQLWA